MKQLLSHQVGLFALDYREHYLQLALAVTHAVPIGQNLPLKNISPPNFV
jgi:hypothetical protein